MKLLTTMLGFLLYTGSVLAQTTGIQTLAMLEQSPAGTKTVRFVHAMNGKMDVDASFFSNNFTAKGKETAGDIKGFVNLIDSYGTLDVFQVNRTSIFTYVFTVNSAKAGWQTLTFYMHDQHPYKINGFEWKPSEKPEGENSMGI
jgi:hypothetical protein